MWAEPRRHGTATIPHVRPSRTDRAGGGLPASRQNTTLVPERTTGTDALTAAAALGGRILSHAANNPPFSCRTKTHEAFPRSRLLPPTSSSTTTNRLVNTSGPRPDIRSVPPHPPGPNATIHRRKRERAAGKGRAVRGVRVAARSLAFVRVPGALARLPLFSLSRLREPASALPPRAADWPAPAHVTPD